MWIMTSNGKSLLDTQYVERFNLAEKPESTLIVAGYGEDRVVAVGRYADKREATEVLGDLYAALVGGAKGYVMPDSAAYHPEQQIKDARVRRRGGS